MPTNPHIQRNLARLFEKHRVVFWYDPAKEWTADVAELELDGVTPIKVENSELATKFRVLLDEPETRFLLYLPSARPQEEENLLLDLLLANEQFHADKASLQIQETGLPPEYRHLAVEHSAFFARKERRDALQKALAGKEADASAIRAHMVAIAVESADASLDSILLHLCDRLNGSELIDPVAQWLAPCDLSSFFWAQVERHFGYIAEQPTLRDFVLTIFRFGSTLGAGPRPPLLHHAIVFLNRWKDSQRHRSSFLVLSEYAESALGLSTAVNQLSSGEIRALVDAGIDLFEILEKRIIHWLLDSLRQGTLSPDMRRTILEKRSRSFWACQYQSVYEAISHGAELLDFVSSLALNASDLPDAVRRYEEVWWRGDFHYRKFHEHRRGASQPGLLEPLEEWVDNHYLNRFLAPLATKWETWLDSVNAWPPPGTSGARSFYQSVIAPLVAKRQKLVVIISDGFRYECAQELFSFLQREDRYQASVSTHLAPLPSYTQLGMAALLPHRQLSISEDTNTAFVDGSPSVGPQARESILNRVQGLRGKGIRAEEFLNLNSKTEGRPLLRDHDVVYVFHNHIDKVGDDLKTEEQTATACGEAVQMVLKLVKKAAAMNSNHVIVTADHGFLFQQPRVEDADCVALPEGGEYSHVHRRFVTGRALAPSSSLRLFSARHLALENEFEIGIAKGLVRFRVKGAGKRFVHGGAMPQEVVVPIVSIHKTRESGTETVEVELQTYPARITTAQCTVRLYQKQPLTPAQKILPRSLKIGIFSTTGVLLSDTKTLTFESQDPEPRNREQVATLTLSHEAAAHNNEEVEIRLIERISGTNQERIYHSAHSRLMRQIESDFDEF